MSSNVPPVPSFTREQLESALQCGICARTLRDPVVAPSGNTFCRQCIEDWQKQHNTCPSAQIVPPANQLAPNHLAKQLLEVLQAGQVPNQSSAMLGAGLLSELQGKLRQLQNIASDYWQYLEPEQNSTASAEKLAIEMLAAESVKLRDLMDGPKTSVDAVESELLRFPGEYDLKVSPGPFKYRRAAEFFMHMPIGGLKGIIKDLMSAKEQALEKGLPLYVQNATGPGTAGPAVQPPFPAQRAQQQGSDHLGSSQPACETLKEQLLAIKQQLNPPSNNLIFGTWRPDTELTTWKGLMWDKEVGVEGLFIDEDYVEILSACCRGHLLESCQDLPGTLVSLQTLFVKNFAFQREDGACAMLQLPSGWSTLAALTSLEISSCSGLAGPLPSSWSALTGLQRFDLYKDRVTGSLPSEWSGMTSLTYLSMADNQLDGPLPPAWAAVTNLRYMYLEDNKLCGALPAAWSGLRRLEKLSLGNNKLSGFLPPEWSGLAGLTSLWLSNNQLDGPLPPEWAAHTNLRYMYLEGNKLSGHLPPEWSSLTGLRDLWLNNNQLDGPLPPEWAALTNLGCMHLRDNKLCGALPAAWSGLSRLESLFLHNNKLSGCLPPEWSALRSLTRLVLEGNGLSGPVPQEWVDGMNHLLNIKDLLRQLGSS